MWMTLVGILLQIAFEFLKAWIKNRPDQAAAEAELAAAHDEAIRTRSARPIRELLKRWKRERQAKGA